MMDEHVHNEILRPRDARGHTLFERIEEEVSFREYMSEVIEDPAADDSGALLRDFEEFAAKHRTLQYQGLDGSGFEVVGIAIADHSGMVLLVNTDGVELDETKRPDFPDFTES